MLPNVAVVTAVLVLLPLTEPTLLAQERSAAQPLVNSCPPVALEVHPGWSISGTWSTDEELVIVDAKENRLLWFNTTGRVEQHEPESLRLEFREAGKDNFKPTTIASVGSTLWLQLTGSRMAKLDSSASRVETRFDLSGLRVSEEKKIGFVFRYSLMDTEDLLGFADLRTASGVWSSGFVRISLGDPLQARVLREVKLEDPDRLWYRLGFPYLASVDGTAFILDIGGEEFRILKNESGTVGTVPLESFPKAIRKRPDLPDFFRPNSLVDVMAAVEALTMPVGLHGWEGSLYILWRRPGIEDQDWLLTKVDPEKDELIGTVILPSHAHHLLVVPGPRYWALVEKGVVEAWGTQKIESMRLVPSELIRNFLPGKQVCR
jgi:hypothetical protein